MKSSHAGNSIGRVATCIALAACLQVTAQAAQQPAPGPQRLITTDDLIAVRDIDTLAVSPDGRSYAMLVRHADPSENRYRTRWYVGKVSGQQEVTDAGDGGDARLRQDPGGRSMGVVVGNQARWSPDSKQIAYTALRNGEVQIWTSVVDSGTQRQVTHNAADVRDFGWSEDGRRLIFVVGHTRAAIEAREEARRRRGYLLEEFHFISEIVHDRRTWQPAEGDLEYWTVDANDAGERVATDAERQEFELVREYSWGRNQAVAKLAEYGGAAAPPIVSSAGLPAWLKRESDADDGPLPLLRLHTSRKADGSNPIRCEHDACTSQMFAKMWWSRDGKRVIFWRKQSTNLVENGFYAWSPATGTLTPIFHRDGDEFRECDLAGNQLICAREAVARADHVVSIDTRTGALKVLADVNAQLADVTLGAVERFEWSAPEDKHGFGYPREMFGFVLYPPNFDPKRQYPVFIAPYGAPGFRRGDVGDEHPLFVYAANGFVVISSQFPVSTDSMRKSGYADMKELYSPERGFPHLTMLTESTWNALEAVAARGFVDAKRIGIGGVSHGAFVPLYMLQHYDRIGALSIASSGWSEVEYYSTTRALRAARDVFWPESPEFWSQIDIADHVEKVEAPLLVNFPDLEFFNGYRLPRRMENAGRAFEAHVFPDGYHLKWQPAHRLAIYNRNLDWFRFWLQDIEDLDPAKSEQYQRWRELRKLQCRNPRSVRDYCAAEITKVSPAR